MGKAIIRLTEDDLHKIISDSVYQILESRQNVNEGWKNWAMAGALGAATMFGNPQAAKAQNDSANQIEQTESNMHSINFGENKQSVIEKISKLGKITKIGTSINADGKIEKYQIKPANSIYVGEIELENDETYILFFFNGKLKNIESSEESNLRDDVDTIKKIVSLDKKTKKGRRKLDRSDYDDMYFKDFHYNEYIDK